jgi:hypothetical protein
MDVYVSRALQPLVESLSSVARDTKHVVDLLEKVQMSSRLRVASFDVEKLYPTLDVSLVLRVIRNRVHIYFVSTAVANWGFKLELLMEFLELVLTGQIVKFIPRNAPALIAQFWHQVKGVTTGLSCAVQVANITFHECDLHVSATLTWMLNLYTRFVDDALCIYDCDITVDRILALFNSWHANIIVTHDAEDNNAWHTSFLDLDINLSNGSLSYSTFRKPANTYSYTPFNSAHPIGTFRGIVSTELFRLLRTNQYRDSYESQCGFFLQKLRYRGYPAEFCVPTFALFPLDSKFEILNKSSRKPDQKLKNISFRIGYCFGMQHVGITRCLYDCAFLLPSEILCKIKFITSDIIAPKNFRSRYDRFL